jgi:GT2 family glycosyltransferase
MPKVSVLVLNYNGERFVKACLESIVAQEFPLCEVLFIDNGSADDSVRIAQESFPQVRLLSTGANLGFAGGMNFGINQSQGDLVLLLNTDVVLDRGFVGGMVEAIETDPALGSVSGKVYRLADREREADILDTTGHVIFRNRLFTDRGEGEVDVGQYDEAQEVFGVCAGVGLYRREMLEDIKLDGEYFDESFFLFLEDTDLNWRAQLRGWKCLYTPRAIAWHWRGGSAERRSKLVELHNYKNRYMMLIKNDSPYSVIKSLPQFLLTDSLKTMALLWRCPPALLGWGDVARNLPALLRKRRLIQRGRTVTQADFERWFRPFAYKSWINRHLGRGHDT